MAVLFDLLVIRDLTFANPIRLSLSVRLADGHWGKIRSSKRETMFDEEIETVRRLPSFVPNDH